MKQSTCISFVNVLNTIHDKGITSKAALRADQKLYDALWYASQDFSHFVLLSKTNGKSKSSNDEIRPGNAIKADMLERLGIISKDDLKSECTIKIITKLDLILSQPIEKQKNYCYTMINNIINDYWRKYYDNEIPFSLDGLINSNDTMTGDKGTYYKDTIEDNTYNGEHVFFENERIRELTQMIEAKKAKEQVEQREAILYEVALLSKRPAEVLVHLCHKLGMKPSEIVEFIIENGVITGFAKTIRQVSEQFDIPIIEIQKHIKYGIVSEKSFKLDTNDTVQITNHIYHLKSRAKKRIEEEANRE